MTLALSPEHQRAIAASVCTPKEYEAWDAVELRGMTLRATAALLGISHTSVRDRLASAQRKITSYSRSDFTRPRPPLEITDHDAPFRMIIGLLVQRDGPCCYLCRRPVPPTHARVEHIIPTSRGGTDDPWNLALACTDCNSTKGTSYVSIRLSSGEPVYHPS